jgi:uncharacterized protein (TIRG00374 family)
LILLGGMMEQVGYKQINKMVVVIIVAILMYIVFLFNGDISKVKRIFNTIPCSIYLLCLLSALCGYIIRTIKWNYSLKQVDAFVPIKPCSEIFFIGTAFSVTPGKLGELIKSYYLKKLYNIEVSRTIPIIFADHLTTLIAWLIFIGFTFHAFTTSYRTIIIIFVMILLALYVIKNQSVMNYLIKLITNFRFSLKYRNNLAELYDSTRALLNNRRLVITILLSLASSFTECFPLFLLLNSLGNDVSLTESIFIVALSTIAGTLSLIPGGIGVLEGSVIGLLIFVGVDASLAISISILERLVVLWFGVLIGLLILIIRRNHYLS